MSYFLSCDWGTTSLRIRLADLSSGTWLAEQASNEGIAVIFNQWRAADLPANEQTSFYLTRLEKHLAALAEKSGMPVDGLKLIISGMASSSIGFVDVPYSLLPFSLDGVGIETVLLPVNEIFKHDVLVIGGARTAKDVMRGEETQLTGCIRPEDFIEDALFIIPGTHSKHIRVRNNQVVDFKTYITGEVFSLLCNYSILKDSVEFPIERSSLTSDFTKGIMDAGKTNLLHSVFRVRTNQLFNLNNKNENYDYLSGLLIGGELSDLAGQDYGRIYIVAGGDLASYYHKAVTELMPGKEILSLSNHQVAEAVVAGQLKIARHSNFLYE